MALGKMSTKSRELTKPKKPKSVTAPQTGVTSEMGANYKGNTTGLVGNGIGGDTASSLASLLAAINDNGGNGGGTGSGVSGGGNVTRPQEASWDTGTYQTYGQLTGGNPTSSNFSENYTPAANAAGFYQHPDVLAADALAEYGITNPEMIDQAAQLADLLYAVQLVMQGSPNGADQTNFIGDALGQMFTAGGTVPTYEQLIGMLNDPAQGGMSEAYQEQADPAYMNQLIESLIKVTTANPYYVRAVQGGLDQNQRDYYSDSFKGGQNGGGGTYADFMRNRGAPGLAG